MWPCQASLVKHAVSSFLFLLFALLTLHQKRGRPFSWQVVHPSTGACERCQLCGRAGFQQRFSHPATWSNEFLSEALRLGLSKTSCVCRMCYKSKFKSGKSSRSGIVGSEAALSDQEDAVDGGEDLMEEAAAFSSDGSPSPPAGRVVNLGESLVKTVVQSPSSAILVKTEQIVPSSPVCVVAASPMPPLKQPRNCRCALPDCSDDVYAHLGHATAATVAAIVGVPLSKLANVSNNRVPLCAAHYRSTWRVLRIMPCLICNAKGQPEMQRQFRANAEMLAQWLDEAGIKHHITAASACCTHCYHQRMHELRGSMAGVVL